MKYFTSPEFWVLDQGLPETVRLLADKNFLLLKSDPHHPSLHFKRIGPVWSARAGSQYRVIGHDVPEGIQWFWIGSHSDYDKIIG